MNILLSAVNAKFIHSSLSVRCLKSAAEAGGFCVDTSEFTINNSAESIIKELFLKKPDVLCLSCYIWNISMVLHIAESVKKILPDTIIALGGPEVSFDPKDTLNANPFIDLVMYGEGEYTFVRLLEYFNGRRNIETVTGIVYRKNGVITENPPSPPVDLNEIPFVYKSFDDLKNKIIYYETQRGCPYSCRFCLSGSDKKLRFLNIDRVKRELRFFLDNNVPQVKFVDRTFNCKKDHAMSIWQYIMNHDNGITNFHMEISAEIMDDEMLSLLKNARPGLFQFEVGVQSTNPDTLNAVNRRCNMETLRRIVEKINALGNIHQHLDLIAGLPYEGYASFKRSFNDVYSLNPMQLQLGFLKLLKGSGLRADAEKYGITYDRYAPYEVLFTEYMPFEDMLKVKAIEEFTETYYNSGKALNTIAFAVTLYPSAFDFYESAGLYMDKNGFTKNQSSKQQTYTNLYNFLSGEKAAEAGMGIIKELLLYDMLLNDNLKTLPDWIGDSSEEFKIRRRNFFNDTEKIHRYLPEYEGLSPARIARSVAAAEFGFDIINKDYYGNRKTSVLFDYSAKNTITGLARTIKAEL